MKLPVHRKRNRRRKAPLLLRAPRYAFTAARVLAIALPALLILSAAGRLARILSSVRVTAKGAVDDGSKRVLISGGDILVQSGAPVKTAVAGKNLLTGGSVRTAVAKTVVTGDPDVRAVIGRRIAAEDAAAHPADQAPRGAQGPSAPQASMEAPV